MPNLIINKKRRSIIDEQSVRMTFISQFYLTIWRSLKNGKLLKEIEQEAFSVKRYLEDKINEE